MFQGAFDLIARQVRVMAHPSQGVEMPMRLLVLQFHVHGQRFPRRQQQFQHNLGVLVMLSIREHALGVLLRAFHNGQVLAVGHIPEQLVDTGPTHPLTGQKFHHRQYGSFQTVERVFGRVVAVGRRLAGGLLLLLLLFGPPAMFAL